MEKILLVAGIIILIYFTNKLKQDLFSPAVINIYWNSIFLLGAVVLFGGGLQWNYGGILWIFMSMIMCLLGQLVGEKIAISSRHTVMDNSISNLWPMGIILMIILGLGSSFFYLHAYGYEIMDMFDYKTLLEINNTIAYDRYEGHNVNIPSMAIVLNIVSYCACLCGGYIWNYSSSIMGKFVILCTFIPILVLTMINNAKLGFIACVFLWGIGWMLSYLRLNRKSMKLTAKLGLFCCILGGIGISFLDFIMLLRIGKIDWETQLVVNEKMFTYAFGQVHAFCLWLAQNSDSSYGLGTNTFMAVADWLGLTTKIQGVYELIEGSNTNVFTQYRGIIADYGILGGQIFAFITGIVGQISYRKVRSGSNNCIVALLILGMVYFSVLHGIFVSPWVYTSYIFAFVGFGCVLLLLKYFKISIRR